MTYIKINKPSLDYNQYSDFHVFTMNNFVRNVMRNGKFKKAVRLVRLGLLYGLKELKWKIQQNDERLIIRNYRYLRRTFLQEKTKEKLAVKLETKNNSYASITAKNKLAAEAYVAGNLPKNFIEHDKEQVNATESVPSINVIEPVPSEKHNYQYKMFEQLQFQKIYTKKPHTIYIGMRNLTAFDMVIQVYSMLTGAWYMRKAKVSGRTILIPSPLRPYRRITTVTKMLMKGIKGRRKEERFYKKAMIQSIGKEFYWLLLYNGNQYGRVSIDNSKVWNAKTDSHKELVHNLKNIKHLKYF